ncbi:MAG TPA: universal stress protein [Ktedonobacterales bacterium]|jgi:nucleotide-binding universal stress UspA family protein
MFKRILVPLDGSPRAMEALEFAQALARASQASLTLLHIEPWGESVESLRRYHVDLDTLIERLRANGLDAHAIMRFDDPEDGIALTAKLENIDLVVLAPHLREGMDALLHPSVTARMLTRSPAPLLIFPDAMPYIGAISLLASPVSCILVPLDGGERAEAALPLAMELARFYDRELLLVRASAPRSYPTVPELYIPTGGSASAYRQQAESYLEDVAARVRDAGLRVRMLVLAGPPEAELTTLLASEPIGLVILCTHWRTGAARLMLGSVARHLIYHATTPLIVLPPRYIDTRGAPEEALRVSTH